MKPHDTLAALEAAVGKVFADGGLLERALPEYERRPAQADMARAVAGVFRDGGTLLVEAGTGTGKTLAYLVPAILSRRRVLISTGTKNLQEQIFYKDLPFLRDVLDVPFSACYMKGRANFLCRLHFEERRRAPGFGSTAERREFDRIARWAETTELGDRGEIDGLPDDLPLWKELSAANENCVGTTCRLYEDCYVTEMRRRAAASDLIIVNHHLLFADLAVKQGAYGEVIPPYDIAVFDEAHQLEDVATQHFGMAVSNYRVSELVRDTERAIASREIAPPDGSLAAGLAGVQERARQFFHVCEALLGRSDDRARLVPALLDAAVRERAGALCGVLEGLGASLSLLDKGGEEAAALSRRARELGAQLAWIIAAGDPAYVYFVETRGRGLFLRAAPVDVAPITRELLFEQLHAAVLTSATLSIDARFDHVASRLGIEGGRELILPPEFDSEAQSILYLPARMPDPRRPDFVEAAAAEVLEILRRSRGRAFVLFTSFANLYAVYDRVQPVLEYPILVQGEGSKSLILEQFRRTPHAVLFATASFWQGVDVVGEALSCVIVDKLPFASPGDPITAARIDALAAAGRHPFTEYQVPLAILALKQGLGRLIRRRSDRGVLAVLDPRLTTMRYGRRFLESLPRCPVTSRLDDIARFFAADAAPDETPADDAHINDLEYVLDEDDAEPC